MTEATKPHEPRGSGFLEALIAKRRGMGRIPVAVCWPCSAVSLQGALEASDAGLIKPLLVGCKNELANIATTIGRNLASCEIIEVSSQEEAAERSVELCSMDGALAIMKGSLDTDVLMHRVVQNTSGMRTNRRMSHVFVVEAPLYRRPLLITDAAINISPNLEAKMDIVQNAIALARVLGISEPKVAILSAVETVHSDIPSTIDAAALCKMADRGQITGAIVDGPLDFDTAVNSEAANIKKLVSPVAGKADILVAPDLDAGNMLAKEIEYLGDALPAGVVIGAKVPIILTSRADNPESRVASCAIAALWADYIQQTDTGTGLWSLYYGAEAGGR
jgi:phosphate acetyltransferase